MTINALTRFFDEIRALASWWLAELTDLARLALAALIPRLSSRATLVLAETSSALVIEKRGEETRSLTLPRISEDGWCGPIDSGITTKTRGIRTVVSLCEEEILTHDLSFPTAVQRNLAAAIDLELERTLPIGREEVTVHHRILKRETDRNALRVRIYIARNTRVDDVARAAKGLGLRPVAVAARDNGQVVGNFLPGNTSGARIADLAPFQRKLVASAAAMAVLFVGLVAAQWGYERYSFERRIDALEPEAQHARALHADLLERSGMHAELIDLIDGPDGLDALLGLGVSMPDGTRIQSVDIESPARNPARIEWVAVAPSADSLLNGLGSSAHLNGTEVVSSWTASDGEHEQVQLRAILEDETSNTAGGALTK